MPLTEDRAKPAVPFGGVYRLIDFALSNLLNSGLTQIVVLTQYKSHSLDRHVAETWRLSGLLNSYVASVPAQQRLGKRWYLGSADAIFQSLNLIGDEQPDIVVVVGADHVYRMDFSQMIEAHIASGKKATVAAIRQPIELANAFGVIDVDQDDPTKSSTSSSRSPRIRAASRIPPREVLASMGNYVFDTDALIAALEADAERPGSKHDMGGDIIPASPPSTSGRSCSIRTRLCAPAPSSASTPRGGYGSSGGSFAPKTRRHRTSRSSPMIWSRLTSSPRRRRLPPYWRTNPRRLTGSARNRTRTRACGPCPTG